MKQVVLVTYEGLYSLPLVEAILINPHVRVVKILKSGTIYGNKTGLAGMWFLIRKSSLFFILPKFFENILFSIYKMFFSPSDRPFKTLAELSVAYGVPMETVLDVNDYPHDQHKGMVLFSSYFNQIFQSRTLKVYEESYNIHPAPLPVGRGLFSQFWLLLQPYKANRYYQTIHKMTSRIDGGAIMWQRSVEATEVKPSMADYMNKVTVLGIDMMRNFDFSRAGDIHIPETESYNSFPQMADVLRFWRKGLHFILWRDIKNYFQIQCRT